MLTTQLSRSFSSPITMQQPLAADELFDLLGLRSDDRDTARFFWDPESKKPKDEALYLRFLQLELHGCKSTTDMRLQLVTNQLKAATFTEYLGFVATNPRKSLAVLEQSDVVIATDCKLPFLVIHRENGYVTCTEIDQESHLPESFLCPGIYFIG